MSHHVGVRWTQVGALYFSHCISLFFSELPGMSLDVGVHEPLCAKRPGHNFTDNNVHTVKHQPVDLQEKSRVRKGSRIYG